MGGNRVVKCRKCNEVHCRLRRSNEDRWSSKCPCKDTIIGGKVSENKNSPTNRIAAAAMAEHFRPQGIRYRVLNKGNIPGASLKKKHLKHQSIYSIKISNLPEDTTETDLDELAEPFGTVKKRYLAKEKTSNVCKGFAYVHYKSRADAAKAIAALNGYGYDHLILHVDWSSPSLQSKISEKESSQDNSKYIAPSRDGKSMQKKVNKQNTYAIKISNLPKDVTQSELMSLVKPFGKISKRYLAKLKPSNICQGFAYVHFTNRSEAAKAIAMLNGYQYKNQILKVKSHNQSQASENKNLTTNSVTTATLAEICKPHCSKDIPLSIPDGGKKRGDSKQKKVRVCKTLKISNLSEKANRSDVWELVKPFGVIRKLSLAKKKRSTICLGFAYVRYKLRHDAITALVALNGYEHENRILEVDWSNSTAENK